MKPVTIRRPASDDIKVSLNLVNNIAELDRVLCLTADHNTTDTQQ